VRFPMLVVVVVVVEVVFVTVVEVEEVIVVAVSVVASVVVIVAADDDVSIAVVVVAAAAIVDVVVVIVVGVVVIGIVGIVDAVAFVLAVGTVVIADDADLVVFVRVLTGAASENGILVVACVVDKARGIDWLPEGVVGVTTMVLCDSIVASDTSTSEGLLGWARSWTVSDGNGSKRVSVCDTSEVDCEYGCGEDRGSADIISLTPENVVAAAETSSVESELQPRRWGFKVELIVSPILHPPSPPGS
jgi:hypothetical protein